MKKYLIYILMLFSFTSVKAMNVNAPQSVSPGNTFRVTVGGNFSSAIAKVNFNGQNYKAIIDNQSRVDNHYQSYTFTLRAPSATGSYNINVILEQGFSDETMKTESRNVKLNVVAAPSNNRPAVNPKTPTNKNKTTKKNNIGKKEEPAPQKIIIKINDEGYEVIGTFAYEGYEASKVKINDQEVEVNKKGDKYIVKLLKGDKEYYALYDKKYKLVPIIDEKIITNISKNIASPSLRKDEILINDIRIKTLELKDYKDLYLVSLLDDDKIYLYDAKSKRISPFIKLKDKEEIPKEEPKDDGLLAFIGINSKKSFITIISLLLLLLIHFIVDIIYISKNKSKAKTLN